MTDMSRAVELSNEEREETLQLFEERADHLDLNEFADNTQLGPEAEEWLGLLKGPGAKLLVGPRGCGKTHLMRYAYLACLESQSPLPVYANFNRYYRLEPLLRRKSEAISLFYSWVLANIVLGICDITELLGKDPSGNAPDLVGDNHLTRENVGDIIGSLERGQELNDDQTQVAANLTIDRVKSLLLATAQFYDRRRIILLMDDAALTLAPEFMSHFFDIFRALKGARIAPKASVYPATTEYGPSFHVGHEAESIFVWKKVTDENYQSFMQGIAMKRFSAQVESIPEEMRSLLAYAAFGVPRSYMTLVRSLVRLRSSEPDATAQQMFNRVLSDFSDEKAREYLSLATKTPTMHTIINAGKQCFDAMVEAITRESKELVDSDKRQISIGLQTDGLANAYVSRMLDMLQEAGLVYRSGRVSHGDRDYERFIPHLAALIESRAFSRSGGFSPKFAVAMLARPDEKHPVRRSIGTLMGAEFVSDLKLDLPNCENCGSRRAEGARYCHNCGAPLATSSTYERCMKSKLADVPGLTPWQRERLSETPSVPPTVGEFLALADKGTALRQARHIGRKRAENVIDAVETFVDEYLS